MSRRYEDPIERHGRETYNLGLHVRHMPMNTKLTLRLDSQLIRGAKQYAKGAGKSLSQVVAEYFAAITSADQPEFTATPAVTRLRGVLKGAPVDDARDYHAYREEKHL